jgi:uncharacterized RDD family membrane protein YckC
VIDVAILAAAGAVLRLVLGPTAGGLVDLAMTIAYLVVLNGRGATVGKRVVGLRVVDGAGRRPGLARGAMRTATYAGWAFLTLAPTDRGRLLALACLAYLLYDDVSMLWDRRGQTVHDKMAGTFVVAAG